MEDCLFCMIAEGKIPSKKLYEDDQVVAFYDINPQAKVHFLVCLLYTSPSPRDGLLSRMPSSA